MVIALDGAESLEIDPVHALAFTNGKAGTHAIDVQKHAVTGTWSNGCATAKGIAIDPGNAWVIVACAEGKVVALNETSGAAIGSATFGSGLDRMAYDAQRRRLYVPSPTAGAMGVVSLTAMTGVPKLLGSVDVAGDARCAVTPGAGEVFVCVPSKGQLDFLYDPF